MKPGGKRRVNLKGITSVIFTHCKHLNVLLKLESEDQSVASTMNAQK